MEPPECALTLGMISGGFHLFDGELPHRLSKHMGHKVIPRSVWTVFGRPKRENNHNRALMIIGAVILQSGVASGKQVRLHMMVNNHWFPDFVLGN